MSLINKMLKDLEKRGEFPTQKEGDVYVSQSTGGGENRLSRIIPLAIAVVVILIGFLIFYPTLFSSSKKAKPVVQKTAPSNELSVPVKVVPKVKKEEEPAKAADSSVVLSAVTFDQQDNSTAALSLALSSATPLYTVEHSSDGKILSIILSNANFTKLKNLPENAFVDSFKVVNVTDNVVKVIIGLHDGVTVKTLDMLSTPTPSLEIVLDKKAVAENGISSANDATMSKKAVPLDKNFAEKLSYDKALQSLQSGNVNKAIIKLNKTVNDYPDYFDARVGLATLLIKHHQLRQAIAVLNIGLKQNQQYIPFVELKARALADQDKLSKAIKIMESHPPAIVDNPDYYAMLAALYQKNSSYLSAAEIYNRLVKLSHVKGVWWIGLGMSLESLGKGNAAHYAYSRALQTFDLGGDLRSYAENKLRQS